MRQAAKWMNLILTTGAAGALLFLWFAQRVGQLWPALGLSLATAALFGGALYLGSDRLRGRGRAATRKRREDLALRLYRLPEDAALRLAAAALGRAHPLQEGYAAKEGLWCRYEGQATLLALNASPEGADAAAVRALNLKRGGQRAVLLHRGEAARQALRYAEGLEPPLALVALESLPLERVMDAPDETPRRRGFTHRIQELLSPQKAVGYMKAAFLLLVFFLFTDRLVFLIPGLMGATAGAVSRYRGVRRPRLFDRP